MRQTYAYIYLTLCPQIKVVQEISDEFPSPTVPNIANFSGYVTAALSLAIINYVVVMAVVQRFASENGYSVDANQELFALGVVSTVSAFFRAQAPSASLSRSSLANSLSPASPLWNIGQFAIVALCIGAFSKLLFHLPYATLAAIIIAAFRPVVSLPVPQTIIPTFLLMSASHRFRPQSRALSLHRSPSLVSPSS